MKASEKRAAASKKEPSAWDYLWYALYAFAGLGLEMVLLGLIEPLFLGNADGYGAPERILHWTLTILCWAAVIVLLVKSSRKRLHYDVRSSSQPSAGGICFSAVLTAACIFLNACDWGTLKIVGEFSRKGLLEFLFQYLYYAFEIGLVFLIVVFGQRFFEALLKKKSRVPFGGIVLCCTWGAIHILSRGNVLTGLGVMAFALIYGMSYLALSRNTKAAFLAMLAAFII